MKRALFRIFGFINWVYNVNWPPTSNINRKSHRKVGYKIGIKFTLSTQLIKSNYLAILSPTQHHSFLRYLPTSFVYYRSHSRFILFSDMLWCAPEHIIDGDMDNRGSQKGDVYSYGIILQEIANRKPPYSMYPFEPQGNESRLTLTQD